MTAPAPTTSEITLEDIAPPCGWDGCPTVAVWVATWSCSCVYFYCDSHKDNLAESKNVRCAKVHKEIGVRMLYAEKL